MDDEFVTFDDIKEDFSNTKQRRTRKKKEQSPSNSDSEDPNTLRIKEFDIGSMPPNHLNDHGIKIVVIGKPGTGKSTLIKDLVASKAHMIPVAQIYSGTEDSNGFYTKHFPSVCVHNKFDMEAIKNFVVRQKLAIKFIENPWAIQIIDDCTDNPSQLKHPVIQAYYKNGRHWKMMHILSLQYCLDILPSIRTNIDYTFILRESNQRNRKALYENYAGCIPDFAMFNQLMDTLTEDFTALVINNKTKSNKLEECVFWYKADPNRIPSGWKFGAPTAWEFSEERNDPNFFDPLFSGE